MIVLSPKQQAMQERERSILEVSRDLVLEHGYYGVTMEQIARASGCPKGTLYHRFACKEDILVTLAVECIDRRSALFHRAAAFEGKSRERALGIGEAAALFGRLHPEDLRIMQTATGPIREKASPIRLMPLLEAERVAMNVLVGLLKEAVEAGDLELDHNGTIEEIAIGSWGLLHGGFSIIQDGIPQNLLGVSDPFHKLWRYFNRSIDAYGWRPLFDEWDYEESLARLRKEVFPVEAQALYGEGMWYGDRK